MIVDNYYRNIFGEPMRKKREDQKKKKDPETLQHTDEVRDLRCNNSTKAMA